ncbi:MAG: glycosyltransferase [Methylomarinum sp.]|nr:glycosyltransferase [Methylomarinum sp.]
MKVLFLTTHSYIPQRSGGSESSTNELCNILVERGHNVAVISSLVPNTKIWLLNRIKSKITQKKAPVDNYAGYPVYRSWNILEGLSEVIAEFLPDCVVTQAGECIPIIKQLVRMKIKTFIYLRDVEFQMHGGDYFNNKFLQYIANSNFTAQRFHETFGIPAHVIPPLINYNKYQVNSSKEKVLFVCPKKEKGLDIALKLAEKNPDIPFLFLESWQLNEIELNALHNEIKLLPNIEFLLAQADMKPIYAVTKLALVPSSWEEAWGRIASEAQVSGIPVLASNRGGLPESVGNGGVLHKIEEDIDIWSKSLRKIWFDKDYYKKLSNNAKIRSQRQETQPEYLIDKFINCLSS